MNKLNLEKDSENISKKQQLSLSEQKSKIKLNILLSQKIKNSKIFQTLGLFPVKNASYIIWCCCERRDFMNQEKIGKFIAKCRKEKKLTQSELGEKLGVTEKSVSNWENGISHIKWHIMKKLKICFILKGKITIWALS